MYPNLFSEIQIQELRLKNRLIMAPLYLAWANEGGLVNDVLLEHYQLMAKSGVAMVVVENASVDHPLGSGSNRTLRADTDEAIPGLARLAETIKAEGALACLQINHAGRFAYASEDSLAPSDITTFGRPSRSMTTDEINQVIAQFAAAAGRVKAAGFDMVEVHGGTGYLLSQFFSPRTNQRDDAYGGSLEKRQRLPLEVVEKVQEAVGNMPVGYRFLADELLPDGLQLEDSCRFARKLSERGIAYISVMGGTYESWALPEIIQQCKQPGHMLNLAAGIRKEVQVPVVGAGRIATGALAEEAIVTGKADLIGLARVLWADPQWPEKVRTGREDTINHCKPACGDSCIRMITKVRPALCASWPFEKKKAWRAKLTKPQLSR
ncbi:MAG: NADH:flavin oxidoreductase [Desulfobulbaceae bacterium]|nr:NADH:flavin oxidoreductase [Desulfobulbaceae bacterium]